MKAVLLGDENVYVEPFDDSVNAQYRINIDNYEDNPGPYIPPERVQNMCDEVIERLVNTHPDISNIDFEFRPFNDHKCPVDMGARGLDALLSLSSLKSLKLAHCSLAGNGLDVSRRNSNSLQALCLIETGLTSAGFAAIANSCGNSLKVVKLFNCTSVFNFVDSPSTGFLGKLESIEDFELDDDRCQDEASRMTDIGFLRILDMCGQSLKYLDISGTNLTGEIASAFSGTLPNLESLSLSYNDRMTHLGVLRCIQKLGENLTYLALNDVGFLGDPQHRQGVPQHRQGDRQQQQGDRQHQQHQREQIYLPRLEKLSMMQNAYIDDIGDILIWLLGMCGGSLKSLALEYKYRLRTPCLTWIEEKHPGLTWVDPMSLM